MKFLDLSTDILAVKCIRNHVFIGIGCTLYALSKKDCKVKIKIDALHPDNIHDIAVKSDNKLIVYGGKSLCIFNLFVTDDAVSIEKLDDIHRFNDWIINIQWLEPLNDPTLTILFAHNNVCNYDFHKKQYTNTSCKETCLLYAGCISGQNCKDAIVLSGTVFQEILIWKVEKNVNSEFSEVLHRLRGHKGVIFSVFYDPLYDLICSTSDDRTVRLWKVSSELSPDQKTVVWENVTITLQTTMYGHLARVWKAILLNDTIASIGEDSRICFWSLSGDLLHKIEAHQGAPIWCIDMSEDNIVFTGGADGSVNSWPLASIKSHMKNYLLLDDKEIVPKHVTFIDDHDILIYANLKSSSKLLHFVGSEYRLAESYDLPQNSSTYCIMELSLDRQCIAFASIRGNVTLYRKIENVWKQAGMHKIIDSKIFSIQWLNVNTALLCAAEGILYIIRFSNQRIEILSQHVLPSSRERWVTSACVHINLLICGDRMGSIFIYKLQCDLKEPIQAFKKIHGRLGVQSCTIMNSDLLTTGRDGTLRFYKFCNTQSDDASVEFLYAKSMPMDWVSRLLRNQDDFYVLGFKEEDFVIYSVSLKRILVKIPCGGGHRSWDCTIRDKLINFVYIQKRQVHCVTIPLNALFMSPMLTGFHTKEIYCVKALPSSSARHNILLSGGEDCTLHINYINSPASELEVNRKIIDSFDGHLSSIKCMSLFTLAIEESSSKHLVFTGGGRAQLKVWQITVRTNGASLSDEDVTCKDLLSYMLHGPDKERSKIWIGKELMYNADPETRYMDLSTMRNPNDTDEIFIFVACSDGYLRTLSYSIATNEIKLIDTLAYNNRCILKVHSFVHQEKLVLITMATDGLLNFWNVLISNEAVLDIRRIMINEKEGFRLHQSGINSFDIKILNDSEYILASGGDDNLLSLLVFKFILDENKVSSVQITSTWKTSSIHYAQITGVKLLDDNRLFSVGADQKLAIHKCSFSESNICSTFLEEKTVCISDIQGITFCDNQKTNANLFCIYGKGFQLLNNVSI